MKPIRLIATSDIHGVVCPWHYSDHSLFNFGLARISTMINGIRDENTIVIDNGDALQGSPLSFWHFANQPDEVSAVTKAMAAIGYDYINIGNHEFDYGAERIRRHIENSGATCLCANVLYNGEPFGKRYDIKQIQGKKLAFFGITTQYAETLLNPEQKRGLTFFDALETAKEVTAEIKEKEDPDYIICIYHGSFENDVHTGDSLLLDTGENEGYRIVSQIPEIDIMIAGHQHIRMCTVAYGTYISETRDDGQDLAVFEITDSGISVNVLEADAEPDQKILDLIKEDEEQCQIWLDTPLGHIENDLVIKDEKDARLHKSQLVTFMNIVQKDKTGAEISATPVFGHSTGLQHEVTMRNIVTSYTFQNTLAVLRMSGKMLKEYLEKCAEYWDIQDGEIVISDAFIHPLRRDFNYDMLDGIEYTIKVSNPIGERIVSLTRNGVPVIDYDSFTVCVSSYRAAGGGDFDMCREAETVCTCSDSVIDLIAQYIMDHPDIWFEEVNNIQVIE